MDGQKQTPATVLVVDDEPILQETIKFNLQREGFTVLLASDGEVALEIARRSVPDLIVLDIMLPVLDGLQVLRILRQESTVPILLLSARGEEIDRVLGLELGADDYLSKPFAMRELVARVRAMMRRARMAQDDGSREPAPLESPRSVITAGELTIDPSARQVRANGVLIDLTPKEFDLLLYLARHPGIVLTRDALLREVWGYSFPVDTRTIDVHIRGIRLKIEQASSQPALIETVRGYGYRFVDTHARV